MIYLNTETLQYPVHEMTIRRLFPSISFPEVFVPPEPFEEVEPQLQPSFDHLTETLREEFPVQLDTGWKQKWTVVKLGEAIAGSNIRAERQRLLQESDWTQVPDSPVDKAAWAEYRQALRDITAQPGFPYTVEWPVAPL
jgi:hypothetical protein